MEGLEAGATGAVSGLGTAFPEVVSRLVHERDPAAHERVVALRTGLAGVPFIAAMKSVLAARGVLVHADVRAAPARAHGGRARERSPASREAGRPGRSGAPALALTLLATGATFAPAIPTG